MFQKYDIDKEYRFLSKININIKDKKAIRMTNALIEKTNFLLTDKDVITQKVTIQGYEKGDINLYIYRPEGVSERTPLIVYFHGGGFFSKGDALTPKILSEYVRKTGATIVYADYRLSLDYPYPTPLEDCYEAYKWSCENSEYLNISPDKIVVMGFSAGGALAAGVTMLARDRKFNLIKGQVLISPVTDHREITESVQNFIDTPNWNSERNHFMWDLYLREIDGEVPFYASPMTAPLFKGLPPAYIEVSEFDPLHDEGINYAMALKEAGIEVELNDTKGSIHMSSIVLRSKKTKENIDRMTNFVKNIFSQPE